MPAIRWHLDRYRNTSGIEVSFTHDGLDRGLPRHVGLIAYRIVQEALTNVARHAGAKSVIICLTADGEHLRVSVKDDGSGFDPEFAMKHGKTLGLLGMRERVETARGWIALSSSPGKGTEISCVIPLDDEPQA